MPAPAQAAKARIDLSRYELSLGGRRLKLERQPMELLILLAQRQGQLVTREDIIEKLWGKDVFVDVEHSINAAVRKIRSALRDDPAHPRYLETVVGKGYRFIGTVELTGTPNKNLPLAASQTDLAASEHPRRRKKVLSAIGASVVLAAFVAASYRHPHRVQALTARDTVVLADFVNSTGDPLFDDALKQALAVQLAQSPFLNVLSSSRVNAALRMMGRSPGDRLTEDVARDLCQRTESKAVLGGSIAQFGNRFALTLNAVNCVTGDSVASTEAEASDKDHVLDALGKVASDMRAKLGESLVSIQKFDARVEEATTPSLEALKAYSLGLKLWEQKGESAALPFFQYSVEIDPEFAQAHACLGSVYSNLGQETFASEHLSRAFELRERASEREKYTISASYYSIVTGDLDKAREACELWNQSYPGDDVALGILGNNYMLEGLWEKALSPTLESLRANPNDVLTYSNLAQNYIALNSQKEAKAAIDQALARNLDYWGLHLFMYYYAFLRGDTAEMNRQLAWGAVDPGEAGLLPSAPADTEGYYGRLHKARQISRRAMESALHTGAKETASILAANDAVREAEFGNADQARERGIAVLEMAPKSGAVKPLAALALARAGNVARAAAIADQLASDNPSSTIQNSYWIPAIRAAIALQRHYPSLAVELLQPTVAYELAYSDPLQVGVMYPAFLRGQAYLDLHQGNQAAAEFQKFFDHRGVILNYPLAALARLGLARAYAMQGNAAMAKSTYQDFLTLWKDADPDIPIYKAAKAEYEKVQ